MKRFVVERPSFIEGMARIVDIGGTKQDRLVSHGRAKKSAYMAHKSLQHPTPGVDEARAIASDWFRITHDMKVSAKRLATKYLERTRVEEQARTEIETHQ